MNAPADAYVASTLGASATDGCGVHMPADTPFLTVGTESNPVTNDGSFMGSSVAVTSQVAAASASRYTVNAKISSGTENGFNLSGTLSNTAGPQTGFVAQFTSDDVSYSESDCTVTLNPSGTPTNPSIAPGRVWATLSCPALANMTTSGDVCEGAATFIFQNCDD
jgi:hypothetical protein